MTLIPSFQNSSGDKQKNDPGLLGLTLRGLQFTTLMTGLKTLVDVGAQLILVRLLFPDAFGILAFLHSMAGFFCYLADLGGLKYIIQKRNLSREDVNTVFTMELIAGVFLSLLWLITGSFLLSLFHKEYLSSYVTFFSLWIILERFQLPRAILEKKMKFGKSNSAMFLGVFCGMTLAVVLAWRGCGVYSLIFGLIFRSFVTAVCLWKFSPVKPRPAIDASRIRPYFRFGLPLMLTSLFTFYYWNVDYLIVGRFLNEQQLGYYYIAFKFPHYMLTLQALISTVVYPAFSRTRDDEQLKRGFTLATKYSGAISLLPCVAVLVMGEGLVRYGLEEKWMPALRPLQVFTCLAAFRMITVHWFDVYLSKGKTKVMPFLSASNAIGVSLAAYIGARYFNLFGVSVGVAVVTATVILFAVNILLKRVLRVKYIVILWKPLVSAGAALALSYLAKSLIHIPIPVVDFGVKLGLVFIFYIGIFLALDYRSVKELIQRAFL